MASPSASVTRLNRLENDYQNINETMSRIEKRLDSLESIIDSDFKFIIRIIFAHYVSMTGGFAAILYVVAHGFHWF